MVKVVFFFFFFFISMIAKVNFKTKGVIKLFPKWFLAAKTRMCYLRGSSHQRTEELLWKKIRNDIMGRTHTWHILGILWARKTVTINDDMLSPSWNEASESFLTLCSLGRSQRRRLPWGKKEVSTQRYPHQRFLSPSWNCSQLPWSTSQGTFFSGWFLCCILDQISSQSSLRRAYIILWEFFCHSCCFGFLYTEVYFFSYCLLNKNLTYK